MLQQQEKKIINLSYNPETTAYDVLYADGQKVSNCLKQTETSVVCMSNRNINSNNRSNKGTFGRYNIQSFKNVGYIKGGVNDPYVNDPYSKYPTQQEQFLELQESTKNKNKNITTFLDLLKTDNVFKYIKQNCEIQKNMIFLTDYFYNLDNYNNDRSTLLEKSVLVCYNLFDFNYLIHLNYNVILITYTTQENINEQTNLNNKLYIDINPPQYNCRPVIYTIVPINLPYRIYLNTYFLYNLNELYVEDPECIAYAEEEGSYSYDVSIPINIEIFTTSASIKGSTDIVLKNQILTTNPRVNSEDSFKLILMGLQISNISITRRLYNHIAPYLNRYKNYRNLNVNNYGCSNIGRQNIDDIFNVYTKKGFKIY